MLSLASKLASITCSVRPTIVDYGAQLAEKRARVEALCSALGRRTQGLKSSDIILGMNSSDELLELRDTLASMELQQRDGNAWAQAQEASRAFKADCGAAACAARVDRKPKKESRFKEVSNDGCENKEDMHTPPCSLNLQRCLPPARGHANNTPRRAADGHGDNADLQQVSREAPSVQGGRGDVALQRRNRNDAADRAGGQVPSKANGAPKLGRAPHTTPTYIQARAPIEDGNGDFGGAARNNVSSFPSSSGLKRDVGGVATGPNGDLESITVRLAKMLQQKTPVQSREGGAHEAAPDSGGGGGAVVTGSSMSERLALLKQSKTQGSRLRSMS